jgi:hypothetical protein
LPSSVGLVFIAAGIGVETFGLVAFGAALGIAGLLRAWWWAKVCATSRLVDDGKHLVWMYRGERRAEVAWIDLRHLLFQRWARHLAWAIGPRSGGPFPFVLVDSRADPPPSGFRHFAEVMLIEAAQVQAADHALADACRRHSITYHGPDSGW